jgi:hypothetical protein
MTVLSNTLCDTVDLLLYDFDYKLCLDIACRADAIDFGVDSPNEYFVRRFRRNDQTQSLLDKLARSLRSCNSDDGLWLAKRGIKDVTGIFSLDYDLFSFQDLLDLYIYPSDNIINEYGVKPVEGPCFCDYRNGNLVGICVRNTSTDLVWAAAAKFSISNYGLFLFGYDDYSPDDEIYVVEGVFDALVMRRFGYNAIGLASAFPSAFQLACLVRKFKNLRICLDNDLHGWCGSYMVNQILGWPIFMTEFKDAGSYASEGGLELRQFDVGAVWDMIGIATPAFNEALKRDGLVRALPYN